MTNGKMTELSFYEMAEWDIPEISEMEQKYFGQPWKEESIAHYMEAGNTIFLVAKDNSVAGGRIAAYMALMCVADESDLVSICTREEYREMGVARELLDIAYEMATGRGVAIINLEVRESNIPAINLYESEGFEKIGKRPGFYDKPREDALLYRKEL